MVAVAAGVCSGLRFLMAHLNGFIFVLLAGVFRFFFLVMLCVVEAYQNCLV